MPKSANSFDPKDTLAAESVDGLCQQYFVHQVAVNSLLANADIRMHKKNLARIRKELVRRLGDEAGHVLDAHAAGQMYDDGTATSAVVDSVPQRVRRPRVMYVEQKTDGSRILDDRGPASIGEVSFSKSGRSAYFNGKKFRRQKGVAGNYHCIDDGNEYWISGVKNRGSNRHWAGGGPVADLTEPSGKPPR